METLNKVVPGVLSKKDESGQEPVSGQEGQGTATQPYDAGNQEDNPELSGKAPQQTESKADTPAPTTSAAVENTSSQPADSKSDQPTEASANGTTGDAKSSTKPTKSGWFANVNPFAKGSSESEGAAEQAVDPMTHSGQKQTSSWTEKQGIEGDSPPNHLGEDVPPGLDSVVVDPTNSVVEPAFSANNSDLPNHLDENVPPGLRTPPMDKGKGKAKMTDADFADYESSSAASNRSIGTRNESVATDYTITSKNTYSTAGTGASTLGSRRQSAVSAPHSQGKTITAGGIPLGQRAMLEREKRLSMTIPEHDFGRIDAIASSNTHSNSGVTLSDAGPSLSKHQDFGSETTRAPVSSPPTTDDSAKQTRVSSVDSKTASPTESKANRRHSSIIDQAKGLGRKFSRRIKPSK